MSLFNLVHGVNPLAPSLLHMLEIDVSKVDTPELVVETELITREVMTTLHRFRSISETRTLLTIALQSLEKRS